MMEEILFRDTGSGKTERPGLHIVTKPAGPTAGIREGSLTRKNRKKIEQKPHWPKRQWGFCLAFLLIGLHTPHKTA